jgi:microcystin-dependent protein
MASTSPLIGPTDADGMLLRLDDRLRVLEQTAILPAGIIAYCATLVPDGWLVCDGSTISAARYGQLVARLGGTTLPDLRGRVVVGKAAAGTFITLLATGGVETVTLTSAQSGLVAHGHTFQVDNLGGAPAGQAGVAGSSRAANFGGLGIGVEAVGGVNASQSHSNLQPYIVLLPIIKF